jgi:predicted nucleotide-binding protein (sugar kinase/HSP70/actin superfamily)
MKELIETRTKIRQAYNAWQNCCEQLKQQAENILNSLREKELILMESLDLDED